MTKEGMGSDDLVRKSTQFLNSLSLSAMAMGTSKRVVCTALKMEDKLNCIVPRIFLKIDFFTKKEKLLAWNCIGSKRSAFL